MPEPGTEGPSPAQIETWELELVQEIAGRYRTTHSEDLAAELAATALELKQRRPDGINDWKAYLATCLRHRASRLVRTWRAQQERETSAELLPEAAHPWRRKDANAGSLESRLELSRIRHRLDAESYVLLEQLAGANWNQSLVARLRGVHRNTIRNHLQRIRRRLLECPIENVSGKLRLTAEQEVQLTEMAQSTSSRDARKARLILALAAGQSYTEIQDRLRTTAPTVSRWKRRFVERGMEGLKAKHRGRTPRGDLRNRVSKWLRRRRREKAGVSCRRIAQELGMSKSTVLRILSGR